MTTFNFDYKNIISAKTHNLILPELFSLKLNTCLTRFGMTLVFVPHLCVSFWTFVHFVLEFSFEELMKYAPITFGLFYCQVVMVIAFLYFDDFTVLWCKVKGISRSLEQLDIKTRGYIRSAEILTNIFTVFVVLMSLLMTYFFSTLKESNEDVLFIVYLTKNSFMSYIETPFMFLYYLSLWALFFTTFCEFFPVILICLTCIFQTLNLVGFIENISADFDCGDLGLFDDENYQLEVRERLIFCIKYHQEINNCIIEFKKLSAYQLMIQVVLGIIAGINIVFYVYTSLTAETFWRIITISSIIAILIITMSIVGQSLKDVTSMVFDKATECPWYLWNIKNREILQIFMANCLKPHLLSMSKTVYMDYSLMVTIARHLYSMNTVIQRFSKIQDKIGKTNLK